MTESGNKQEGKPARAGGEIWWQPALLMFGRLSGWVIGPVLVGAVLGQWLDNKYHTDPWWFLGCIGVSFIISIAGLVKNALEEYKKVENLKKDIKDKEENKK